MVYGLNMVSLTNTVKYIMYLIQNKQFTLLQIPA